MVRLNKLDQRDRDLLLGLLGRVLLQLLLWRGGGGEGGVVVRFLRGAAASGCAAVEGSQRWNAFIE